MIFRGTPVIYQPVEAKPESAAVIQERLNAYVAVLLIEEAVARFEDNGQNWFGVL